MAHCFNSIEIPYSIVVFCDYGVQFIIKDFDEPHHEEISQLIFDAIMVPRCSTRIADACYFISQKDVFVSLWLLFSIAKVAIFFQTNKSAFFIPSKNRMRNSLIFRALTSF